jgi:phosphatidate cytidylyltransferase
VTDKNRNLLIRIVTALVALPIVIFALWQGGVPMAALASFGAGVGVYELYAMALGKVNVDQVIGIAVGAALPVAMTAWPARFPMIATAVLVTLPILFLSLHLIRGEIEKGPARSAILVFGVIYAALLLSTLCGIRQFPLGAQWLFLTLAATWLNDTGAYTFGRLFGHHKLAPSISPSKTWEGFWGGGATSIAGTFAIRAVFFSQLTVLDCIVLPVVVSVLGPLGDLCESMIKRAYGVKDSGKIMPGHGGILDRVDALLFTAPFVYLYVLEIKSRINV